MREDRDLRGRKPGDVANIVCRAIREVSPATECEVVLDEIEALRHAVNQMIRGEVVVLFYEKLQPIQKALEEFAAQPVLALLPETAPLRSPAAQLVRPRRISKSLVPAMPHA